jgi:glycosyltransferase involved in cell wall biosynthesis
MLNEKPTVSVILPTYNRAHLVGRAIQSVLDQTYQDFEIIVVDDGSKDNTEEVINGFTDTRIRYVKHQQNKGGSAARNTGIKFAKGKYIAFQDSDDEWLPRKLEIQRETFEVVSLEVGVIYTDMLRIENNGNEKYWHSPTVKYGSIINSRTLDYQVIGIGIQSTLIKRECFDRVGVFDERFPRFIDLDLFVRLLKNYHFYHIKKPLVKYWATEGISSNNKTISIARKLLLEKYFEDVKQDSEFIANQYSMMVGHSNQVEGLLKGKVIP